MRAVELGILFGRHCSELLESGRLRVTGLAEPGGIPQLALETEGLSLLAAAHHGELSVLVSPLLTKEAQPIELACALAAFMGEVPSPRDASGQLKGLVEYLALLERSARAPASWVELVHEARDACQFFPPAGRAYSAP